MCPRPRRFAIDRASMRDPGVGWRRATWWLVLCGLAAVRVVVAQGDCDGQNMTEVSPGNCLCDADTFPFTWVDSGYLDNPHGEKDSQTTSELVTLDYSYGGTNRLAFGRNDSGLALVLGGAWVGNNAFWVNVTSGSGHVFAVNQTLDTGVCIASGVETFGLKAMTSIAVSDDGDTVFLANDEEIFVVIRLPCASICVDKKYANLKQLVSNITTKPAQVL